jgi:hypothetical protein
VDQEPILIDKIRFLAVGVLYGAVARVIFGYKLHWRPVFTVMSVSFLFLVPLVLGFLVVYVGEGEGPPWGWWRWIVTPWIAALLALGGALALAWEGIICVFLWLPVFLIMSNLARQRCGDGGSPMARLSA